MATTIASAISLVMSWDTFCDDMVCSRGATAGTMVDIGVTCHSLPLVPLINKHKQFHPCRRPTGEKQLDDCVPEYICANSLDLLVKYILPRFVGRTVASDRISKF
ncbi:hypothetical protein FA15DRAFT_174041 [Coprinopsis marcescibilis]|uniref:Secreted protein n=1 Tax=Coprinopsis marcescibilis TaxID=230819 RepID=A0A5C3KGY0_COPMA|nr:hypothetical protein FA15DRAFT_174041 [Coprinopsis marcescibilis]